MNDCKEPFSSYWKITVLLEGNEMKDDIIQSDDAKKDQVVYTWQYNNVNTRTARNKIITQPLMFSFNHINDSGCFVLKESY